MPISVHCEQESSIQEMSHMCLHCPQPSWGGVMGGADCQLSWEPLKLPSSFLPKGKLKKLSISTIVLSNDCAKNVLKSDQTHSPSRAEPTFYVVSHLGKCVSVHRTCDKVKQAFREFGCFISLALSDHTGLCTG